MCAQLCPAARRTCLRMKKRKEKARAAGFFCWAKKQVFHKKLKTCGFQLYPYFCQLRVLTQKWAVFGGKLGWCWKLCWKFVEKLKISVEKWQKMRFAFLRFFLSFLGVFVFVFVVVYISYVCHTCHNADCIKNRKIMDCAENIITILRFGVVCYARSREKAVRVAQR